VIYVDEVARFAGIKAYGCVGLIASIVEVFSIVAVCKGGQDKAQKDKQ
jgi:hypothetical protein